MSTSIHFSGLYSLQILNGLTSDRSYLSCWPGGETVDLWSKIDSSGRQKWQILPIEGEPGLYSLQILNGLSSDRSYLSCWPDGETVDLWKFVDPSGRQKWQILPV